MVYISRNRGLRWSPLSVQAHDKYLTCCECSMARLPDGRILALLRENSFVFEPMYLCLSNDEGQTWSDPRPTPLVGHRPTIGLTVSGRLLVTYRDVGPDSGTAAWLGSLDELDSDFRVHGLATTPPAFTPDGMLLASEGGRLSVFRYALRPLTDPARGRASLAVRLQVHEADEHGFAIRFGGLWIDIAPDRVRPLLDGAESIPLQPDAPVNLRLDFDGSALSLDVDGRSMTLPVTPGRAENRPIIIGNRHKEEKNRARATLASLALSTTEPRYGRDYQWRWDHTQGTPDQWVRTNVLELMNARHAHFGDYGYSGWTELEPGRFICAYHHADGLDPDYVPDRTSYILATNFEESDFNSG